jgi:hypothetical protein
MIQTADSAGQTSVGSHITHLYSAGWGLGALAFAANLKNSCHIGLVLLGKFTDFTPRFNGKNHGFRLRFSVKTNPLTEGILSYQVRKTGTGYDRLMSRTA